jgi:uncharacterized protein (DUF2147 family)
MAMRFYKIAFAVAFFSLFGAITAYADPRGLWLAQDGGQVRVSNCGQGLCATVAAPRSAVDPETGGPWTDRHNPDQALRGRPLVGVYVLYNMMPDGAGRWSGTLYNIDDGNTYPGHLIEIDRRTIRVEGCALGICGGKNLTRLQ